MPLIAWSPRYETGLPEIDREHQELFKCVNAFHDAMKARQAREKIEGTLRFLLDYSATHFRHEEEMLLKEGYPEFGLHKAQHDRLAIKVNRLLADHRSGAALLTTDVSDFLGHWLTHHVLERDMAYVAWLKTRRPRD